MKLDAMWSVCEICILWGLNENSLGECLIKILWVASDFKIVQTKILMENFKV